MLIFFNSFISRWFLFLKNPNENKSKRKEEKQKEKIQQNLEYECANCYNKGGEILPRGKWIFRIEPLK